jgi:hypothetical protein
MVTEFGCVIFDVMLASRKKRRWNSGSASLGHRSSLSRLRANS